MVRKGEYLERAVVIPGSRGPLEGLYHRGHKAHGVLIAPPSPKDRGTMESAVVAELAWALTRAGHPTLRFNYRGVGASPGDPHLDRPEHDLDPDLVQALEHLRDCLPQDAEVGAVGVGQSGPRLVRMASEHGLDPVMLVAPAFEELPEPEPKWPEVVLAYPQQGAPDFERLQQWVERLPNGHLARLPGADPAFRKGLVELGQLAVSRFSPTGGVDLPEA